MGPPTAELPTPAPPIPDEPGARLVSAGGAPPTRAGSPPIMLELLGPGA
jgi:hypothetical protein